MVARPRGGSGCAGGLRGGILGRTRGTRNWNRDQRGGGGDGHRAWEQGAAGGGVGRRDLPRGGGEAVPGRGSVGGAVFRCATQHVWKNRGGAHRSPGGEGGAARDEAVAGAAVLGLRAPRVSLERRRGGVGPGERE